MAVVKNLMVRAGADFSGISKETKRAQASLKSFQSSISSTMGKIKAALIAVGIGKVIKDAVGSAMSVEASIQQIGRIMGANADQFMQWANTQAAAYGMAKSEATKYGAVYGNLISGFAKDTGETMAYTESLLKASSVIASSTGRSMEDVMERIRSGLLGNTEAIEDLGVNVNVAMIESTDAFRKFANGKSWQKLDFQTQQQIRLMAILEQTSKKYGDTVNQNTASSLQQFVAQLKNIQLALGQAFLPIVNFVLPALTALASKIASVFSVVAQFMQALFGKSSQQKTQTKSTQQQAAAVTGLGNAYKAAGQKAKGALAGFDEVNQLSDDSSAGSGSSDSGEPAAAMGATTAASNGDMTKGFADISTKAQEMAAKVKAAFTDMRDFIVNNKEIIISSLAGIAAGFVAFEVISNITTILNGFRTAMTSLGTILAVVASPAALIAVAIAALVTAFLYFYQTNEGFRGVVDGILNSIKDAAVFLWQNVLVPLGQFVADVFVEAWDKLKVVLQWIWQNIFVPLGNFLLWFWNNVITPLAKVVGDILGTAFKNVSDIAKSFWEKVMIPLGDFFKDTFGPAVEAVSAIFTFLMDKVLKPLWNNVMVPFATFLGNVFKGAFTALTDTIEFLWYQVLKPLTDFLGGIFKGVFDNVFSTIGDIIKGLKETFIGLMNFITGIFTGDWSKAWEGVKKIFSGIWDTFYSIVKAPINLIIDAINWVIGGLNKISFDIPDWIPLIGGKHFGVNITPITKLAKGGITNGPMMAMIGDNPGGHEVVSPLDDLKDMISSAVGTAVMAAMQFNGGSNKQGDLVLQIDGTTVARILNPFNSRETARIGGSMIVAT